MEEQNAYTQCGHWWDQTQKTTNQKKPQRQTGQDHVLPVHV